MLKEKLDGLELTLVTAQRGHEVNKTNASSELKPNESASEQIFAKLEEDMEPGGVRDLWLSLQRELNEGGQKVFAPT